MANTYDALVAISAKKPAKIHFVIPIPPLGFVVRITQPRRESDIEQICRTKGASAPAPKEHIDKRTKENIADGSVVVGEPIECPSAAAAIGRAGGMCKILGHTGAVAFSRTGDPATGEFSDATVLRKLGDVPDDLRGL
jgi:hypothetical protein